MTLELWKDGVWLTTKYKYSDDTWIYIKACKYRGKEGIVKKDEKTVFEYKENSDRTVKEFYSKVKEKYERCTINKNEISI